MQSGRVLGLKSDRLLWRENVNACVAKLRVRKNQKKRGGKQILAWCDIPLSTVSKNLDSTYKIPNCDETWSWSQQVVTEFIYFSSTSLSTPLAALVESINQFISQVTGHELLYAQQLITSLAQLEMVNFPSAPNKLEMEKHGTVVLPVTMKWAGHIFLFISHYKNQLLLSLYACVRKNYLKKTNYNELTNISEWLGCLPILLFQLLSSFKSAAGCPARRVNNMAAGALRFITA